jgi:hypothetical protein
LRGGSPQPSAEQNPLIACDKWYFVTTFGENKVAVIVAQKQNP